MWATTSVSSTAPHPQASALAGMRWCWTAVPGAGRTGVSARRASPSGAAHERRPARSAPSGRHRGLPLRDVLNAAAGRTAAPPDGEVNSDRVDAMPFGVLAAVL